MVVYIYIYGASRVCILESLGLECTLNLAALHFDPKP